MTSKFLALACFACGKIAHSQIPDLCGVPLADVWTFVKKLTHSMASMCWVSAKLRNPQVSFARVPKVAMHRDTVSEWLRRWTRNPLGSAPRVRIPSVSISRQFVRISNCEEVPQAPWRRFLPSIPQQPPQEQRVAMKRAEKIGSSLSCEFDTGMSILESRTHENSACAVKRANAASEDRTHDLGIMGPARYQLRYSRYDTAKKHMFSS